MKFILLSIALSLAALISAQQWVEQLNDPNANFYDIQTSFYEEWDGKTYERGKGWKQFKRWEWYMEPRVYPTGNRINTQMAYEERMTFEAQYGVPTTKSTGWTSLGPDDWESISYNPGIGRINIIVQHPTNDQIIYAGSPSGGIWKTTDGGATWENLNDDFPTLGVSGIAIDYTNPQTIYIATGDKDGNDTYSIGVVKSTDGGQTWNATGLTHNLTQFLVCRELKMHPTDPNTLFVATNDGLFKTSDAGNNWDEVASGNFRDVEFQPGDPSVVYASEDRFWRSSDGGNTFSVVNSGLPNTGVVNRMELAVSEDEPAWVYALTGKESDASYLGLYLSTDGGQSFQLQSNSPNLFGYAMDGDDSAGQSWYDMAIDADPTDASTVVVGGINVWSSTNAGVDWDISSHWVYPSSVGYTHADIHKIRYFNGNLYCGSDGGIFISTDNGVDWTDLTPGMVISQFYRLGLSPQNANLIIGGTQDNGSNVLDNGVWTHVFGADGMEADINPTNADIIYCTYQFGGLRRSLDGGLNWSLIFDGDGEDGGWVTPYEAIGTSTVIAGYENVWKSTNNGNSFAPISNFSGSSTIRDLDVYNGNEDIIYIAFSNSIRRTTDGGNNWENITNNLPTLSITDIQVHPNYPDIVWVTTSGYSNGNKVFVTTDGGDNWQNISQNLPNIPANAIVYQEGSDGGLYVGMDVGIYYTDSTLSNWQAYDLDLPNVIISELEIHYGSNSIRAATYGRGIWETELFIPSVLPPEADFNSDNPVICPTDSLLFTDASVNAAPGWTWYFPGGSPTTSTLASPKVLYPASGNYTASLVVENANGSDSIAKSVEVILAQYELDFALQTDNYPSETNWEIIADDGSIISEGGGYATQNALYEELICLPPGCYEFIIYDAYGDGICCDFGNGFFELTDSDQVNINGGQFQSVDTYNFCLEDNTGINQTELSTFTLFPNPAQQEINVLPASQDQYSLSIHDQTGRTLYLDDSVNGMQSINVSNFDSGVYHITLRMAGILVTKKFVKE